MNTCASEKDRFHLQVFCGPTILKAEYAYHDCDSLLCPLHGRIVPRALQMDSGRMTELHAALKVQHPIVSDKALTTIAEGLRPTMETRLPPSASASQPSTETYKSAAEPLVAKR